MPQPNDALTLGLVFNYEGELLHQAAIYDQHQLITDLLNVGGSGTVKSVDPEGRTPLHTAASHGSVRCVKALLERGADPNTISGIEDECCTPVHHAAKRGHLGCLAALLEYEVNLDLKNSRGKKALDVAIDGVTNDCKKCADYILKKMMQRKKEIEAAMCEELYDVIDDGDCEKAREILQTLSDPYSIVNKYYRGPNTLLYRASFGGYVDIVNLLLDYQADGRSNADSGITPLYAACFKGHYEVAAKLIQRFPKQLTIPVTLEQTFPLHAAVINGHLDIISLLLKHRQTEENMVVLTSRKVSTDSTKHPPLKKRSSTVSSLDSLPAEEVFYVDVNKAMKSGYTPLHLAVIHGGQSICQLLLDCEPVIPLSQTANGVPPGALIIDCIANDKTPFHHALTLNKLDIVELFLKYEVDLYQPLIDSSGFKYSILQYACQQGYDEMARLLLHHGFRDRENVARIEAVQSGNEQMAQIILNHDVQQSDHEMVLAASEMNLHLKSVSVSWHKKGLDLVKEEWLIEAGISLNSPNVGPKLRQDMGLTLKLFTSIDLSNNSLESVPLMLFQMPSLKNLNLSENNLSTIPTSSSSLEAVPSIEDVTREETDAFAMFTLNWNCPSLETLDMSHNHLKDIPKNVFEMPNLQTANFGWNKIGTLPFEMWIAPSLKTLHLEHNCLKSLPMFAGNASASEKKIKKMNTAPAKNTDVPDGSHANKKNHRHSYASEPTCFPKRPSWNEESDESDADDEVEIFKKSGIGRLDVSDNELTVIPPGLPCLAPNLSRLVISKNKITEVDSLSSLPEHLMALDISDNHLKYFNLMAGKEAEIVNNICYALVRKHSRNSFPQGKQRKTCLHRKHKQLTELNRLMLNKNSLESLQVCLRNTDKERPNVLFPDLKILDISHNKLSKVPPGIGRLKNLSSLILSHNNNLTVLPSELGLCNGLYELKIESLHLKDPPKNVIENAMHDGRVDVRSLIGYLKSLHDNAQLYPNIKLMIVGTHGIGKTTLLHALRKEGQGTFKDVDYQCHFNDRRRSQKCLDKGNKSTVGVDVSDWIYGKKLQIKFSTWDFAGQTEYYATHQCFLSKRALYLVMWRLTDGLDGIDSMQQWLLNIQERAPNCSVIIVGTFLDEAENKRKNYVEDMRKEIYKRFVSTKCGGSVPDLAKKGLPKVVQVIEVNSKSQRSVARVRQLIYDTVVALKANKNSSTSLLETKIPKSYIDVEKAVTKIMDELNSRHDMPVLNEAKFRKKVLEHLTLTGCDLRNGTEELDQAVQFLHDYGILLHYDDPALRDLYFVDPQWLCDMLAHVVTVRSVNPFIKNGVLKISDLKSQIFKGEKRFPTDMVMKYVELMSKFEVAIKISEKFLLIPSLLPDKQKECTVIAENESEELRKAMNVNAYLNGSVLRRQYLMSYVPSGFWARLLTRLIADNRIGKIVSQCCDIQQGKRTSIEQMKADQETLMRAAPPEWACWKTGIELSCFGAKMLRVCQLGSNEPYYGGKNSLTSVYVKSRNQESTARVGIEIVAPSLTLTIEKFNHRKPSANDADGEGQNLVGFRVTGTNYASSQTACKLLVITTEHIDNLLGEWYPKIDTFVDLHGIKAIRRISFCDRCLSEAIEIKGRSGSQLSLNEQHYSNGEITGTEVLAETHEVGAFASAYDVLDELGVESVTVRLEEGGEVKSKFDTFNNGQDEVDFGPFDLDEEESDLMTEHRQQGQGKLIAFELEEASKLIRDNKPLLCPFHVQLEAKNVFPDLCFMDLDKSHIIAHDQLKEGKFLGRGSYGDVFMAELTLDNHPNKNQDHHSNQPKTIQVAMKIPMNSEKEKNRKMMATMFSYDTYRNVRQELSILGNINHVNIIRFYGVSVSPFAMLLELAPMGAVDDRYKEYRRVGKRIHPFTIQKSLQQISSALKYLHRHHIIYRDLKAENVLVLAFPGPNLVDPIHHQVLLKLTDYGISRSVSLGGIKGFLGTPGFMAPEILRYTGKESYTDKEKRSPVLLLSLLYRCWAQHPEDRPSAAEINALCSLEEFPKLADTIGLAEDFNFQCVTTTNQSRIDSGVVDSRSVVGSHLWFCGYRGFGAAVAARKEGFITVFSYHDGRYTHVNNIKIRERVVQICSVGSFVWIGTEAGHIQVFCALTYKPVAFGFFNLRVILKILHSPVCGTVFVSLSDGSLHAFDDNISKYNNTIPQNDAVEIFHKADRTTVIRKLEEKQHFTSQLKIHCMAGVTSFALRRYSQEVVKFADGGGDIAVTKRDNSSPRQGKSRSPSPEAREPTLELWCGQDKGRISILEMKTLREMRTLPVTGENQNNDFNEVYNVILIETSRTYDSAINNNQGGSLKTPSSAQPMESAHVWVVAYPGTKISRWNVDKRVLEESMDVSQHSPWHDLNSAKPSKKSKSMRAPDAQIVSLVVVEKQLYVGTTAGCLLVCDAMGHMVPRLSVRCYDEFVDAIIPLRMITSRNPDESRKRLVLTCGRKCLDAGIRIIDRKKSIVGKENTFLVWAHLKT
ncbi:leucine-rich repeat serine/threonine-protein kinase 1-like isoform X2 [Clytia hemisphaerica]|uniref:leucine-rich repeat serine/threonine-protein kinase 1-like isoform X2 n=1 Tax=Clytia hemisphaerica TaxID=252671 RepID=UPI0034D5318B